MNYQVSPLLILLSYLAPWLSQNGWLSKGPATQEMEQGMQRGYVEANWAHNNLIQVTL